MFQMAANEPLQRLSFTGYKGFVALVSPAGQLNYGLNGTGRVGCLYEEQKSGKPAPEFILAFNLKGLN